MNCEYMKLKWTCIFDYMILGILIFDCVTAIPVHLTEGRIYIYQRRRLGSQPLLAPVNDSRHGGYSGDLCTYILHTYVE